MGMGSPFEPTANFSGKVVGGFPMATAQGALPHGQHPPAAITQFHLSSFVPILVKRDLLPPKCSVLLWENKQMASVPVPKATVYEHYCFKAREYQIWGTWQVFTMKTVPKTLRMERLTQ
jgi:hypothetical protein